MEKYNVSDILEVACGTGYLMDILEDHGYMVTGLDISEEMLRIAKTRVKGELLQQDMRYIGINQVFDAVLCLGRSFAYMINEEDVDDSLQCFNKCLREGGLFIFDNFNANHFDTSRQGKWKETVFCFNDLRVRRLTKLSCWDECEWTWVVNWNYIIETGDDSEEFKDHAKLKAFSESYLRMKLAEHGFKVSKILNDRRFMIFAQKIV